MVAYRIDEDFKITRVEDVAAEMKARAWDWDRQGYDDRNDVWCNDWGLIEAGPVLAWIGQARRVPLPALIRDRNGYDLGLCGRPAPHQSLIYFGDPALRRPRANLRSGRA